jgi:hypothetical protein
MDEIDIKAFIKLRETDLRARQMIDMAVAYGLQEIGGEPDYHDYKRFAYEVATLAVTGLLKFVYEDDSEIRRLREERDHYKRIAEEGLRFMPTKIAIDAICDTPKP